MIAEALARLRFLVRRRKRSDLDDELAFHLEQATAANIAAGMNPVEAHRQARISFGGMGTTQEAMHQAHPAAFFDTLVRDLRYALRGLRRNPIFTLTVVLTLSLGIGATTAVFSVVDRILFRSLPYDHGDRLVSVGLVAPIEPQEFMLGGSYYEWRDHQTPFVALTSETGVAPCDLTEERPERLSCASVEHNFLPTLGVTTVIGRNFTPEEDTPHGPKSALISYRLWRNRFHSDRATAGKSIQLDGHSVEIVGVLPPDFEMPRLQAADILLPQALDEAAERRADPGHPMWAFARLKPGVSIDQATARLQPLFEYSLRLAPAPFRKEVHLRVRSLRDRQIQNVRLISWILFGLVIAVLLIAGTNVSGLLLARSVSREKEWAVHIALGASKLQLGRQSITESLLLGAAGAVAGCLVAEILLHLFLRIAPGGLPFLEKSHIDARVMLFTLLSSVFCAVLASLVPLSQKLNMQTLANRTAVAGSRSSVRHWLVVLQISVSMVLLVSSALLLRSFGRLENQQLGLQAPSVVTASISLGQSSYPTAESQMEFFELLAKNVRYGPGITSLAVSDSLPPGDNHRDQIYASIAVEGQPKYVSGTGSNVAWRGVTPDYFRTLGIPILRGRVFSEEERSSKEHFVILSKALAARLFPGSDPIGQHLHLSVGAPDALNPLYTIVGVVADVKNSGLQGEDEPEYYRLRRHMPEDWDRNAILLMDTSLAGASAEAWLRSQVAALDPSLPVRIEKLSERISDLATRPRFETALVSFFALTGLALAMVGLYGVISFDVAQRTQEIGVRIALGATKKNILTLVLRSGLRLILCGTTLGLLLALAASQLLASVLYQTDTHDFLSFSLVALGSTGVALAATLLPAAAATTVDPNICLRRD